MRVSCWFWVVLAAAGCNDRKSQPPPVTEKVEPARRVPAAPQCQAGERTCVRDDVVQCNADGSLGTKLESCTGQCRNGACMDTCALQDVELIYVADDRSRLYSFDPRKLPGDPFHPIGTLKCNDSSSLNSMAVDRSGIAWLGYLSGAVYRASIIDARCTTPGSVPVGAPSSFGMGFATDGPKATTEKLFVTGGGTTKSLAVLDTSTTPLTWKELAPFDAGRAHPELTGTGDGRLFGYFPSPNLGLIEELDKTTANAIGERWVIDGPGKQVSAYAFAHWGGVFYVFFTVDGSSSVHAVHMKTRKQERLLTKLPMVIVGAGVSTCAPLLERVP